MARGESGRMVIEVQPDLKRELYGQLKSDGLTLKEWFSTQVDHYLKTKGPQAHLWSDAHATAESRS